ncbi:gliding motility-associated C-terminal domain-containing protein [Nubsella zeaxanthinifaciens]|uniref:T9SS type B sorting domain-containing protein n=1 Tax=Nubsella zeaxanthinifaciens TaxID=392412 RepID=UPI000DE51AB8|nr:gliding motility-associated C-terminal domain-containing protein [Nubsella zeaxanthinifaciens]
MKKTLLILTLLACWSIKTWAQATTYINGAFDINAGMPVTWYGDVTFGPNAVVYIEDGATAIFYGKNMVVSAGATFIALPGNGQTGTGKIIFRANNPLYPGYPLQQTLNGGYASGLNPTIPNIEIDNTDGLSLTGNVRVSNTVTFTKGHLFLNNFNLVLDDDATLNAYDVTKHVVTNGSGVIVKENLPYGTSFQFPVSIAGLDFTPATVTNQIAPRNISVQVKNYAGSPSNESVFVTKGMDRTWQISSNTAGAANVSLQHNTSNNTNGTGTNEANFRNSLAYVSQQIVTGVWTASCTGADGGSPISVTSGNNVNLPNTVDPTAFFTKRSVECVDLAVTKSVNNVTPLVGSNITFTVTVNNKGVVDATGVRVDDLLPTGYTFVSSTVSAGSYNAATGVWSVGNLANGATATLTVTATIKASGNYTNTAVASGDQTDPDLTNNTATATPTPGALQTDLSVQKTVDNAAPFFGYNVVFTVTAKNSGPQNATGVAVTDLLPSGYTFVSATSSTGTYVPGTGVWSIGNLANGASATLTVTATVKSAGPYANTATITGLELDPVPGNNTATATPIPNAATVDLNIVKTATATGTYVGQEFEYTLRVTNVGANLANGVAVSDILAGQLEYISTIVSYGSVSYNTGNRTLTWNVGSLAAGASVNIIVRVKSNQAVSISNTAIVSSTETDIDLANNTSTVVKDILDIHLPNIITPNGDGKNDTFVVPGLEKYAENSLTIYNRWGNQVWKSTGKTYRNEWDGRGLNGATYFYVLRLKDSSGNWQVMNGWVTLTKD